MAAINFKDVDYYGCKALANKPAKIYIRKGVGFFYVGEQKYLINELPEEERWDDSEYENGRVKTVAVDFSKDFSYKGVFTLLQNKEGYSVAIANKGSGESPVIIRLEKLPVIN